MMLRNRYWLERTVGKGGFAVVYQALDTDANRRVAVKEIPVLSSSHGDQIEREIHILSAQVSDLPFVPAIYDYWNENGKIYLVMEWIDGQTVWEMRNDRWSPERVEHFLRTMLGYLTELHARGIIHRDLHPKNIKLDPQKHYVLLDFGIAKDEVHTLTMAKAGQPRYAPLEQLIGDTTDARSDLYTLGATAYHLLIGQPPPTALERRYDGVPLRLPRYHIPNVPATLETTLLCMLELDAIDRPASASEALRILDQQAAPPPPQRTLHQPAAPRRLVVPPLQQSRRAPTTSISWGCVWLMIVPIILLVMGGVWFSDQLGSTIPPLVEVLAPARAAQSTAVIATLPRSTDLPQATATVPQPTDLPQATATVPQPTETSVPSISVGRAMHSMATAKGLGNRYTPVGVTSTFTTNERVYVSYQIDQAQPGEAVRFKCFFNDQLFWEWAESVKTSGAYTGYFVVGPLRNPGTYRGELTYKDEMHTLFWDVR